MLAFKSPLSRLCILLCKMMNGQSTVPHEKTETNHIIVYGSYGKLEMFKQQCSSTGIFNLVLSSCLFKGACLVINFFGWQEPRGPYEHCLFLAYIPLFTSSKEKVIIPSDLRLPRSRINSILSLSHDYIHIHWRSGGFIIARICKGGSEWGNWLTNNVLLHCRCFPMLNCILCYWHLLFVMPIPHCSFNEDRDGSFGSRTSMESRT